MTLPIFDDFERATANRRGPVHAHGPLTERSARDDNLPRSGTQRRRVLEAIGDAGIDGRTDFELEEQLNLRRPSPGNRRGELVADGLVADTDRTRPTNTGSPAVVWALTDAGRDVYRRLKEQG